MITLWFFIKEGWIEFGIFGKLFQYIHSSTGIFHDLQKDASNGAEAERKAMEEEARRKEEADFRRSVINYRVTRNDGLGPTRNSIQYSLPKSSSASSFGGINPMHAVSPK